MLRFFFPNLRFTLFKNQQGITYIEIMVVVVILGIIATVAIPNLSSSDHKKLDIAAAKIAESIRFSRAESIRTAIPHGVKLDSNNDRIKVYSLVFSEILGFPVWTPTFDVYHPVDKKLYTLNLKTDTKTAGVDLQSYSIYYSSSGTSSQYIGFNSNGNPKLSSGGTDKMLNGTGTITLGYAGQTRVIKVSQMTGRVTVQ
jgi:prepilin-type N-terminal cleavage/methylation domain-containing protein